MKTTTHACTYCGSVSMRSAAAIAENLFCASCLHERIRRAVGGEPYRVVSSLGDDGHVTVTRAAR